MAFFRGENCKHEIVEHIGVISQRGPVWTLELNRVSWYVGEPAKYDIREWDADHTLMSRGITLTEEQARALYELLKGKFEK